MGRKPDCAKIPEILTCSPQSECGKQVLKKLNLYSAKPRFDHLLSKGAVEEELLFRLVQLDSYDQALEPRKLSSKKAKAIANSIKNMANQIEVLNRSPHGHLLSDTIDVSREVAPPELHLPPMKTRFSFREILTWPEALREYADRVRGLPSRIDEKWKPLKAALLSQLVWYVKYRTGKHRQTDVAALVAALWYAGKWSPQALKEWCSSHEPEINKLGPLSVLPISPHPFRKK